MRQSHLILSNAVIMWTTQVLNLIPQFIFVPFLISTIGETGYGVYALVWPLVISIDQLMQCLQQGVVKYCAGFQVKGRIDQINHVVSSSFVYSVIMAMAASLVVFVIASFYSDSTGQVGKALVIVGMMVLLTVPLTPYVAVIQSRQRYYVDAVAGTMSKFAALFLVVILFRFVTPSVEVVIAVMAGTLFFSRLAQVPLAYRLMPGLRNHIGLFDKKSFRLIASFGAATVILSLCLVLNSTGIRWLMDLLVSTQFVAHLAIMLMPGLLLFQLIGALNVPFMAVTSAIEATGNQSQLRELMMRGMRYTVFLVLASIIPVSLLLRWALTLWVGRQYAFLAPYSMIWFGSVAFLLSTSAIHQVLKGTGRLKAAVIIYLLGLVLVPAGTILSMVLTGGDPYVAVTVGLAAGNLISGGLHIGYSKRFFGLLFRDILTRVYAKNLVFALVVLAAVHGAVVVGVANSPISRVIASVLGVLIYVWGGYAWVATLEERCQLKEYCRTVAKRQPS